MRCFIAIDSGGTKTDAVLFDETGHILARSLTMGCNAMDIGIDTACQHLLSVLQALARQLPPGGALAAVWPLGVDSAYAPAGGEPAVQIDIEKRRK